MNQPNCTTILEQMQYRNYIPPVTEYQIGWMAYAERMPVTVCATPAMKAGWHQANRDEAAALTSQVYAAATNI